MNVAKFMAVVNLRFTRLGDYLANDRNSSLKDTGRVTQNYHFFQKKTGESEKD